MRAIFGLLLIMFGLAMAVVWMPAVDAERQLAMVTDIATHGGHRSSESAGPRTFASNTPLLNGGEPVGEQRAPQPRVATGPVPTDRVVAAPRVERHVPPVIGRPAIESQAIIGSSVIAAAAVVSAFATAQPPLQTGIKAGEGQRADVVFDRAAVAATEMSRYDLVRSIQRELKRLGCYAGEIDGDWGPGSRRAMVGFIDRVNASLPVYQPDFILLTLLKGHSGTVCGPDCPGGQTLASGGRCMPSVVVARARAVSETTVAADAATRSGVTGGWTTTSSATEHTTPVSSAAPIRTGVTPDQIAALVTGSTTSTARPERLPGRMSVGGPVPAGAAGPPQRPIVQGTVGFAEAERSNPTARNGTAAKKDRAARRSHRAPPRRYADSYAAPVAVYRAPRVAAPRYYTSRVRRSSSSWTASFFRTN